MDFVKSLQSKQKRQAHPGDRDLADAGGPRARPPPRSGLTRRASTNIGKEGECCAWREPKASARPSA